MRAFTPGAASVDVASVSKEALEAATSSPTPDSSDEPFKLLQTASEHLPLAYHRLEGGSPGLMFLPGFMSNMTSGKAMALEAYARDNGREYVRFDYHGHGSSGGRFEECTLGGWIENALDILDKVTSGGPMVLVGSSMGMWIAIHVALRRPDRVAGLVGIGAAPDFTQRFWLTLSAEDRESFEKDRLLLKQSPYSEEPYKISLDLVTEARQHLLLNNAENTVAVDCPIRLLHGCQDVTAPPHLSSDIMNMVTSTDVEVTLVKDGDHRLSTPRDLDRMVRTVEELLRTLEGHQKGE
ncbi:hypothetical protein KFL_005650030 [Klebsormidium nitens]|uniref:Serine aminopeptidase S33 domain-containing protein n=1 Tax=Klebsormidium nitens TaxID=105231 RepID=A0A1Y1IL19_KLENI|nr:hypothetical protein KFL_005650030 [Klebsormidium nitens]|eukprot:GAQ89811.1 hypothetical protein KFL_005650030 [Klebsormidium nitens]